MIGPGYRHFHGQRRLESPATTLLATPGQYYKILGTFIDGDANGFVISDNKLKYIGQSGTCFHFTGVSDLSVDKASQIIFSLYVNGLLYVGAQTPHDFPASAKVATISITSIVKLNQDDELEVYAKSDTANTTIAVSNLNIVFWG
jgi:hypothetical protein